MLFHVREGVARCDLANFLQEGWAAGRIFFPQAVLLHAQCSANRAGFGRNANSGSRRYGGDYAISSDRGSLRRPPWGKGLRNDYDRFRRAVSL